MPAKTIEDVHYHLDEGHLCIDFVNTAYIQTDASQPFGYHPIDDKLTDLTALATWGEQVGVIEPQEAKLVAAANPARVADFVDLREALRRIIRAQSSDQEIPASALRTINQAVPPVLSHTRVAVSDHGFHVAIDELCGDASDPDHVLDHLIWAIGQSIISLLTDHDELDMIRACPADDCGYLFRDTSHGRRRWCDMKTCGNRAKVQRFRERQKVEA